MSSTEYAVRVVTDNLVRDDDDYWDALVDELAVLHGAPSEDEHGRLVVRVTVEAATLDGAVFSATDHVRSAIAVATGQHGEAVSVETTTAGELDRRAQPPVDVEDLVSTAEAAVILGTSRQRVAQLSTSDPDFPPAMQVGKAWLRSGAALRRYARKPRRPGPRHAANEERC